MRQRCPVCGEKILAATAYRPFCSLACADRDLARWLGGAYRIPGPPVSNDEQPENQNEE